jgi:hypothetical protein
MRCCAESKDLGGAYLIDAARSFSKTDLVVEDDYGAGEDARVSIKCVPQQTVFSGFCG